jgi:hypothetical protein
MRSSIMFTLHHYYFRMIKSRRMRWAGHVMRMWEMRNACKMLVGKTEGKKSLEKHRHIWEDNIKMGLGK